MEFSRWPLSSIMLQCTPLQETKRKGIPADNLWTSELHVNYKISIKKFNLIIINMAAK